MEATSGVHILVAQDVADVTVDLPLDQPCPLAIEAEGMELATDDLGLDRL